MVKKPFKGRSGSIKSIFSDFSNTYFARRAVGCGARAQRHAEYTSNQYQINEGSGTLAAAKQASRPVANQGTIAAGALGSAEIRRCRGGSSRAVFAVGILCCSGWRRAQAIQMPMKCPWLTAIAWTGYRWGRFLAGYGRKIWIRSLSLGCCQSGCPYR